MGLSRANGLKGKPRSPHGLPVESSEISLALEMMACCKNGCFHNKTYTKAIEWYEITLRALENPEYAIRLARLANIRSQVVRECSLKIVDLLLFNKRNDPFLSLGFSPGADKEQIHRRWKRLLVLFHPDRSLSSAVDVKRTMAMNAAYQRIGEILSKSPSYGKGTNVSASYVRSNQDWPDGILSHAIRTVAAISERGQKYFRKAFFELNDLLDGVRKTNRHSSDGGEVEYLRYLPSIIVFLTLCAAIVMFSLYIFQSLFSLVKRIGFI